MCPSVVPLRPPITALADTDSSGAARRVRAGRGVVPTQSSASTNIRAKATRATGTPGPPIVGAADTPGETGGEPVDLASRALTGQRHGPGTPPGRPG